MGLTRVKYWQWIVASLIVGVTVVGIHRWSTGEMSGAAVPQDLSGEQRRFEAALLGQVQGHALLRDITVMPHRVIFADGSTRMVHVVEADYCTGEPEQRGGQPLYIWRDSRFVLPVPYRLQSQLSDPSVAAAYEKRIRTSANPTVCDLLDAAGPVRKSGYSYAWWDAYPWPVFGGGSVLLIGIVIPVLVRLLAFGRLTRPAAMLSAPVEPAINPAAPPRATPPPQAPVLEPEPVNAHSSEYGMKQDDYYPTERRLGRT